MSTTSDLSGVEWIKSSYSNTGGGDCVEWAPNTTAAFGVVPVRDSKNPHGPALIFQPPAFAAFIAAISRGELGES